MSNLSSYFGSVKRHSLLSRNQEQDLAQRIEKGDMLARDEMIQSNLRLAISIAKKYQNRGCDFEDLIQEANIGLMKAVERFDWRKGYKFSTYATWWIRQAVSRHVSTHSRTIRIPSHAAGNLWKIKEFQKNYEEEFNNQPTISEIAAFLSISESQVEAALNAGRATVSIDMEIGNEDGSGNRTIGEMIPDESAVDPSAALDHEVVIAAVREALASLTPREEKIIRMRFGIPESPEDHENFPITESEIAALDSRQEEK